MGQLGTKLRRIGPSDGYTAGGLAHWCPACEEMHAFALDGKNASGAQWTWDGNVDAPTFKPSMHIGDDICAACGAPKREHAPGGIRDPSKNTLCGVFIPGDATSSVCHYILTAGVINYGGDCTHAMKGQSVPLPELPAHLRDDAMLKPDSA